MTAEEKASAIGKFLDGLTIAKVATASAFAAALVAIGGEYIGIKNASPIFLTAFCVGMLLLAIGSAMWAKLEAAQSAVIAQWRDTVLDLKTRVTHLEGMLEETNLALQACLDRDRRNQQAIHALDKKIDRNIASGFGDLGAG